MNIAKFLRTPILKNIYERLLLNRHPTLPQHVDIQDIELLLSCYDHLDHNENLKYRDLVRKIITISIVLIIIMITIMIIIIITLFILIIN